MEIPFIPFTVDRDRLGAMLDQYASAKREVTSSGRELLVATLPSLACAERVLWAATGVKRCSSFRFDQDVAAKRVSEERALAMFAAAGLEYHPPGDCYPEPAVSQQGWILDTIKAHMRQPYRQRDAELARWFDYPGCCVEGYRSYFDAPVNALLARFPYRGCTDTEQLDALAYGPGGVDRGVMDEIGAHIRAVCSEHPELDLSRRGKLESLRAPFAKDEPRQLLLHFCLPVHDPRCAAFRAKADAMYGVLRDGISEEYAQRVVERTLLFDVQSVCF